MVRRSLRSCLNRCRNRLHHRHRPHHHRRRARCQLLQISLLPLPLPHPLQSLRAGQAGRRGGGRVSLCVGLGVVKSE